jgi:hypothetical protein
MPVILCEDRLSVKEKSMLGQFAIWIEDEFGHISKAMTWNGLASEGIEKARAIAIGRGLRRFDIWATPIANQ